MILPIILGFAALGGLLIIVKKKALATPETLPPVTVPFEVDEMVLEIRETHSVPELNAYYNKMSSLFIEREISFVEYMALYRAYEIRFQELSGVVE